MAPFTTASPTRFPARDGACTYQMSIGLTHMDLYTHEIRPLFVRNYVLYITYACMQPLTYSYDVTAMVTLVTDIIDGKGYDKNMETLIS